MISEKVEVASEGDLEKLLKEKWSSLVEGIREPQLRIALKNVRPKSVGEEVVLEFSSNFYKDNVDKSEHLALVESGLLSGLGRALKVRTELVDEANFKPQAVVHAAPPEAGLDVIDSKEKENDVDSALKIFGGEVM